MRNAEFYPFVGCEIAYALAFLAFLCGSIFRRDRLTGAGTVMAVLGVAAQTAFLVIRWALQGHAPIVSLFELVSGGSWFAVLILLALRKKVSGGIASATLAVAFLGMGSSFFVNPGLTTMSPLLRSYWLYIHVLFALIAYGCFTIAAGGGIVYLVKARRTDEGTLGGIDGLNHRLIAVGFVTTTVMIAAGAVWAHYAWGRYWGWDPVETGSLCTWIVYGLYLHLWLKKGWKGKKAAWLAAGAFPLVLFCFWILPFVMPEQTQHTYQNM